MAIVRPDQSSGGGGSGTVKSVKATDTSIVVAGTATDPTIATGTLDVIAADHPPVADWSNNSHKITGLANGAAASDAAAFGQLPPLTIVTAALAAPVTIVNALTYYDGPSGSFEAGTWLVVWSMAFSPTVNTAQSYQFTGRLWDGTTTYSEDDTSSTAAVNSNLFGFSVSGNAVVTLGATTTLKISGTANRSGSVARINSDPQLGSSGAHVATRITGVRLA